MIILKSHTAIFPMALVLLPIIVTGMFHWNDLEQSNKVRVSLYYESLCGDCRLFVSQKLCPLLLDSVMKEYITVEFVPYGNAKSTVSNRTGEISITCQHGQIECAYNRIQSCALKLLSYDLSTRYICCCETSKNPQRHVECAHQLGIKFQSLYKCSKSPEGIKYLYENGVKTEQLRPQHEYVPWVLLNGQYDKKAEDNLFYEICERIPDPKPPECNEVDYLGIW